MVGLGEAGKFQGWRHVWMPSVNAKHQRRKRASQRALDYALQPIHLLDSLILLLSSSRFDGLNKAKVLRICVTVFIERLCWPESYVPPSISGWPLLTHRPP